ncbi:hypothetical protein PMIN06_002526 [Paraphaeosphaeria minitans]
MPSLSTLAALLTILAIQVHITRTRAEMLNRQEAEAEAELEKSTKKDSTAENPGSSIAEKKAV